MAGLNDLRDDSLILGYNNHLRRKGLKKDNLHAEHSDPPAIPLLHAAAAKEVICQRCEIENLLLAHSHFAAVNTQSKLCSLIHHFNLRLSWE